MVCLGKRLHASVVRQGQRRHAPGFCPFQKGRRVGHAVHIAHLGMTVQLHSLFIGVIHTRHREIRDLFDPCHGPDGQLMVETVQNRHAFYFHKSACLNLLFQFRKLIVLCKHFHMDRIGKIGNRQCQDRPLPADLPLVDLQNPAADGHFSHLFDHLFQRHGLIIKITPVQYVGIVAFPVTVTFALRRTAPFVSRPAGGLPSSVSSMGRVLFSGGSSGLGRLSPFFRMSFLLLTEALAKETDLLFQFCLTLLNAYALFQFQILKIHLHMETAPFIEHPVQDPQQVVHGLTVIDPVRDAEEHRMFIRELHLRMFHQASLIGTVRLQFRQHALFIDVPEFLRGILPRQLKFFKDEHLHLPVPEDLFLDLFRQMKKLIFGNQLFTRHIDPQHIPGRRHGYSGHYCLLEQSMLLFAELQRLKYFKKRFFIHSSSPVHGEAR